MRLLDNRYAILFIRGERPVIDGKYNILMHPNVDLTADGSAKPFTHGEITEAVATIIIDDELLATIEETQPKMTSSAYELLCEEELQEYYENLEETENETN